jgi:hypothetical protein
MTISIPKAVLCCIKVGLVLAHPRGFCTVTLKGQADRRRHFDRLGTGLLLPAPETDALVGPPANCATACVTWLPASATAQVPSARKRREFLVKDGATGGYPFTRRCAHIGPGGAATA